MAEIKIEKKRPIWPAVLIGIVIVGLIIYFVNIRNQNEKLKNESDGYESTEINDNDLIGVKENNSIVESFVAFVKDNENEMDLDHDYTYNAIIKLADAIDAMAEEINYELRTDLEQAKALAYKITIDPDVTTHANSIRKSTDLLTEGLKEIQQYNYPGLKNEVSALSKASGSINPDVLTLNQQHEVKNYFKIAADLLKKMN